MSTNSMIHQLMHDANGKIDHVVLNTGIIPYLVKNLDQAKLPALIIDNHLPVSAQINMKEIAALRNKGVEFYPAGRTGMPALVTAEDGLAVPGAILASNDKNLLELSVLGAYVLIMDNKEISGLLNSGSVKPDVPEVKNIVLQGQAGEWIGGIDIALYLAKYFDLPKDKLLEFQGEGLNTLPLNERFNLARTLIGLGYDKLLFQVDDAVMAFLQDRTEGEGRYYFADTDAPVNSKITIELQKIHPMIAWKENDGIMIGSLTDKDNMVVNSIFIGGDTACRFSDIQDGLKLIRYTPLADTVTGSIIPGSQLVFGDLLDMGVAGILTEIGFDLLPSSIMDLISEGTGSDLIGLGTSFTVLHKGCMVANALSCFSAAVTGRIIHPLELESILDQQNEHEHEHEHEHK